MIQNFKIHTYNSTNTNRVEYNYNASFLVSCPGPELIIFTPFSEIPDDDDDFLNVTMIKVRYL